MEMIGHEDKCMYLHLTENSLQIELAGKCFPSEGQISGKMLAIITARTDVIRKIRAIKSKGPRHRGTGTAGLVPRELCEVWKKA
jgi:hypothetical protein